jgi:hypothetical protein
VTKGRQETQDRQELAQRVQQDRPVIRVRRDRPDPRETKELLGIPDPPGPVPPGTPEIQDPRVRPVRQEQVPPEIRDLQVQRVTRVRPAIKAPQETRDLLVRVLLETRVLLDQLVLPGQDPRETQAQPEIRDRRDLQGQQEIRVLLGTPDPAERDLQVILGTQVQRGQREIRDLPALPDLLEIKVPQVTRGQAEPDQQDRQEIRDRQVPPGIRDPPETRVRQGRDPPVPRDLREIRDPPEVPDRQDQVDPPEILDLPGTRDPRETLGIRAPVLRVRQVQQERH